MTRAAQPRPPVQPPPRLTRSRSDARCTKHKEVCLHTCPGRTASSFACSTALFARRCRRTGRLSIPSTLTFIPFIHSFSQPAPCLLLAGDEPHAYVVASTSVIFFISHHKPISKILSHGHAILPIEPVRRRRDRGLPFLI